MDSVPPPSTAGGWSHSYMPQEGASLRPFNMHWLDSALQETLLPGTPWEQIESKVSRFLVSKLRSSSEFKDTQKKQMILQLLGPDFVRKHFKDEMYVPQVLEEPRITLIQRQQLQRSMQKFLKDKLDDIATFHEYLPSSSAALDDDDADQPGQGQQGVDRDQLQPVELSVTKEHMRTVFQNGLDSHLVMNGHTADKATTERVAEPGLPSMNAWSRTSDLLGHSLCAILQRDPNRFNTICRHLKGRPLPPSLREFMWAEVLLRQSNADKGSKERTTEKTLRKAFARMVSKGKLELKIAQATECPINGLISKAVQEKFESTLCMQHYKGTSHVGNCSQALNVLYTYNRSYEPYLVHWLFPLQVALQNCAGQNEDHPYELAFYLDLLQTHAFPRWPEIYAIAEQTMTRLHRDDADLYLHLHKCSTTNVKVDPKEFMVQLLEDERKKAASFSWATSQPPAATEQPSSSSEQSENPSDADASKSLLASPVVFVRKWVGEGFVSVLDTQAMLYVWDQFFLSQWDRQVLENMCLALMLLLKADFMEATDYHQMKQVFLQKPSKLYTADLQVAFRHLQSRNSASEVPNFDRRNPPV